MCPTEICLCARTFARTHTRTHIHIHKLLLTKKSSDPHGFTNELYQKKNSRIINTIIQKLFPCASPLQTTRENFSTYSLKPLSSDTNTIPRKLHINISYEYKYKFQQQNTGKTNPTTYKKEYTMTKWTLSQECKVDLTIKKQLMKEYELIWNYKTTSYSPQAHRNHWQNVTAFHNKVLKNPGKKRNFHVKSYLKQINKTNKQK